MKNTFVIAKGRSGDESCPGQFVAKERRSDILCNKYNETLTNCQDAFILPSSVLVSQRRNLASG